MKKPTPSFRPGSMQGEVGNPTAALNRLRQRGGDMRLPNQIGARTPFAHSVHADRPPTFGGTLRAESRALIGGEQPSSVQLPQMIPPMNWSRATQFDSAIDRNHRIGDHKLVPPFAGFLYPSDAPTQGNPAFLDTIRAPIGLANISQNNSFYRWKITLRVDYVPGTTVRLPGGQVNGYAGTASLTGAALDPTKYQEWAQSPYYDAEAVDRGFTTSDGAAADPLDNVYYLRFLIITAAENEASADLNPSLWGAQSSPGENVSAPDLVVGPTNGPVYYLPPGGIVRRVSVKVGDSVTMFAGGRTMAILAYNPNFNWRQSIGAAQSPYQVPGLPLIASYSLDEGAAGYTFWRDAEEVWVQPTSKIQLDIPPFCQRFQIFSDPTSDGNLVLTAAAPGGQYNLIQDILANPISIKYENNPLLVYYLTSTASTYPVVINYDCTG